MGEGSLPHEVGKEEKKRGKGTETKGERENEMEERRGKRAGRVGRKQGLGAGSIEGVRKRGKLI